MEHEERYIAKDCLKDNAGDGQEVCSEETLKQNSPIDCFVEKIYCEIERLQSSTRLVRNVTNRLTGGEPEESLDDTAKRAEPDCEFDKLDRALQHLAQAIDLMGYQASRLSDKM